MVKLSYDLYLPPGDRERNLAPVILLHGMLDCRKTWSRIAPCIAQNTGRKVYAVDARNHGDSPWVGEHSFDLLSEDMEDFLRDENITKAVLIGHSMGGRTALTLALKRPEKVEKLIVEDMVLWNFRPDQSGGMLMLMDLMEGALENVPPGADHQRALQAIQDLIPQNTFPEEDFLSYSLTKRGGQWRWTANFDSLRTFLSTDRIRQKLSGVYTGDALFVYGTNSFFKIDRDRLVEKFFPKAVKFPFPGATHLVHFEFPDSFVSAVSQFINSKHLAKL